MLCLATMQAWGHACWRLTMQSDEMGDEVGHGGGLLRGTRLAAPAGPLLRRSGGGTPPAAAHQRLIPASISHTV